MAPTPAPVLPPDAAPDRPDHELAAPGHVLSVVVAVDVAHLANPLVAVSRLLASEAGAFARVTGDEGAFTVTLALPDGRRDTADRAEGWVRWAVHNAGVRGRVTVV